MVVLSYKLTNVHLYRAKPGLPLGKSVLGAILKENPTLRTGAYFK